MNYVETFIAVAEDCPATGGVVPEARSEKKTVAVIQYELLAGHPYEHTQEDVLFQTYVRHKRVPAEELEARGGAMRDAFFAEPQPCLRTSPLAKTYGWGFHFDHRGKVALYPMGSAEYADRAKRTPTVLRALRSRRA